MPSQTFISVLSKYIGSALNYRFAPKNNIYFFDVDQGARKRGRRDFAGLIIFDQRRIYMTAGETSFLIFSIVLGLAFIGVVAWAAARTND